VRKIILASVAALALASCTTTDDQQQAAAKAYDKICTAEPPLYAAFVNAATVKGASEKTLAKAEALHVSITTFCETRPTDVVTGLVTLSAAYVQFVTINASVK
jgi:hypothetical protein